MSFFITSIAYYPEAVDKKYHEPYKCTCTFGHFCELKDAQEAVAENRCDLHECLYNYLVIEDVPYGIHAQVTGWDPDKPDHEWWYMYLGSTNRWVAIEKPDWAKQYIGWSIG